MKSVYKYMCAALVLLLTVSVFSSCSNTIERSEYTYREQIYIESQTIVANELLYPPSAVFPEFESTFVADNGEEIAYEDTLYHTYTVTAYVDSQNAFGAMFRTEYQVIIGVPVEDSTGYVYYEIVYLN